MKFDPRYLFQRVVGKALKPFRLEVVDQSEVQNYRKRSTMERLRLAQKNGLTAKVILDGGAFKGLWTRQVAGIFPGAQFILVEPNPHLRETIGENIKLIDPHPIVVQAALGEKAGQAELNFWQDPQSDAGASLLEHVSGPATQRVNVEVETIDGIAQRHSLWPDLIKLDLQGGELAAMKGGEKSLQRAECAVIEFGCLNAYLQRTTPRELIDLMIDHDFCLYDIAGLADRPYDNALTGGDFIFVKNSSLLRSHAGWA